MQEVRLFVRPWEAGGRGVPDLRAAADFGTDVCRDDSRFPIARAAILSQFAEDSTAWAGNLKAGAGQRLDGAHDF